MRLALLGLDDSTLSLAAACAVGDECQVVAVSDLRPDDQRAAKLQSAAPRVEWETLLLGSDGPQPFDAVVAARGDDEQQRNDQIRRLVQAGIPLLISHPVSDSMLVGYELDMIRRDTGGIVLPILPLRFRPAVMRFRELIQEIGPTIGTVEQLAVDRCLDRRERAAVSAAFAHDCDLLRFLLAGLRTDIARIGATGAGGFTPEGQLAAYGNLSVQMTASDSPIVARWNVLPGAAGTAAIMAIGGLGTLQARLFADGPDEIEWKSTGHPPTVERYPNQGAANQILDQLRKALQGQPHQLEWPDAARSVELTETLERSLKKGRMVELHREEFSDLGTFKGTMTSAGCALLLIGLAAMVAAAAAARFFKLAGLGWLAGLLDYWPHLLLAMLALFLLLQSVLKLAERSTSPDRTPPNQAP